jgi:hypothetical protein
MEKCRYGPRQKAGAHTQPEVGFAKIAQAFFRPSDGGFLPRAFLLTRRGRSPVTIANIYHPSQFKPLHPERKQLKLSLLLTYQLADER